MKNWKEICISPETPILELMKTIDKATSQFAAITSKDGVLLGTVTDGDIRRALLKGIPLTATCDQAMNQSPSTATEDLTDDDLRHLLKVRRINHLPIVDNKNKLINIKSLVDLEKNNASKRNPIVLMAGGLGTRLGELTENCPKPLLRVREKPILEIIVDNFKEQGFNNFYFAVNYRSEMIEEHFENGKRHGVEIKYLREEKKLGTAGALSLLNENLNQPVLVMNGDLLTKVNFNQLLEYHQSHKNVATMCVRRYEFQVPYGVVKTENDSISEIEEKPTHYFFVNAGIYVLNPDIISMIPKDTYFDMPTLFNQLIEKNKHTGAFPIHEYWLDIGQKDDYAKAQSEF